MRWQSGRRSTNVEDRRGMGGKALAGAGMGVGGLVLLVVLMLMGVDPRAILQPPPPGGPQQGEAGQRGGAGERHHAQRINPEQEELVEFTRVVLASTEDVWHEQFQRSGERYQPPKLVLFTGQVSSACGHASAAVGPFYCPTDQNVYLDLAFFDELHRRFGAPGDTAQAYVIAHEVGHHIQQQLGYSERVQRARARLPEREANALSVRLELQADYLAGVWAHHAAKKNLFEPGDIEEALNAASAIGDDRLQKQGQGYVVPDAFTHGTSAQRARWFREGYKAGDLSRLDEFFTRKDL
jgi:uncharacterized protein